MSAGSFDASDDGSKRRIAHKAANLSADLFKSLTYKRESMGKLLNGTNSKAQSTPKKDIFAIFSKRSRISSESENEKMSVKKRSKKEPSSVKTFCGKSFMSAVTSQVLQQKETKSIIQSDSEESDPNWLSKSKTINGLSIEPNQSFITKPPNSKFTVRRRAVLSSSDEDSFENNVFIVENDNSSSDEKLKKKKNLKITEKNEKKTKNLKQKYYESDVDTEEDEEEIVDTPSSSEEDSLDQKKSLKQLSAKTKKMHRKRKKHGKEITENNSDDDEDDDKNAPSSDEIEYNSDDSNTNERQTKKYLQKRKFLEEKCLTYVNTATKEELLKTEKFNERLTNFIINKRPFINFADLTEDCSTIGRGVAMIEQYVDFLENRSILDQVLDDCRKQSEQIKNKLKQLETQSLPSIINKNYKLHFYQQVGLNWLIMMHKLGLNAILADEMGLGKTIQIIAFLAWSKQQPKMSHPHLIIVPSSTLENWMNEIEKWCPSLRVLTYYGSIQERTELRHRASTRNIDVILTTYNMVISRAEDRSFFKKFSINYVIYDEGHMLRSCNTMRYKNLMRVQGKRKILLTGTPLQNNLIELISLLFFTMTKLFTKYCNDITTLLQMFARKGNALHNGKHVSSHKKKSNTTDNIETENNNDYDDKEINSLDEKAGQEAIDGPLYEKYKIAQAKSILQPFVLRRLKANVLVNLPKKHEKIKFCDITPLQHSLYAEILNDFKIAKENGNANYMGSLMEMRQVANHPLLYRNQFTDDKLHEIAKILCSKESKYKTRKPEYVAEDLAFLPDITLNSLCNKYESLCQYKLDSKLAFDSGKCQQLDKLLPKIFEKNEKVLIFSQFTTLLDILELYAENRNYKYCRLDGSTPVMERQDLINQFNQDSKICIFLLSTKAGGLGINLTAANNIIIHDIDLNPYNDKQAEDRCHRMGQTREVFVTRLISKNTIEESILELAKKKLELEKDVTSAHKNKEEINSKTVEELLTQAINLNKL